MNLPTLIAECKAVRTYLLTTGAEVPGSKVVEYAAAVGRMDRIIDTLERLAASPYASGIETALRRECAMADTVKAIEALRAAKCDSLAEAMQACNGGEL